MRKWVATCALAGALLSMIACGELLGSSDDPPAPTPATDAGAEVSVAPDSKVPPAPCTTKRVTLRAVEDTGPAIAQCAGAIATGGYPGLNVGVGVLMVRFDVADAGAPLGDSRIVQMTLELTNNRTCDGTCGDVPPETGRLQAHVMSNDWESGDKAGNYDGADMCRRNRGNPGRGWGAGGDASTSTRIAYPADFGIVVGGADVAADITKLDIPLAPATVAAESKLYAADGGAAGMLSFYVQASGGGRLVVASRESKLVPPPQLHLDICDP